MEKISLRFKMRIEPTKIKGKKRVSYIKKVGAFRKKRWYEANNESLSKIYILKLGTDIIYIGITKSKLSNRFRYGLAAIGANGYHGYKWKELASKGESSDIDLFVYLFKNNEKNENIEAIEGEIAYLVRNKKGDWPKYQTEIHFHPKSAKEVKIAEKIYNQVSTAV